MKTERNKYLEYILNNKPITKKVITEYLKKYVEGTIKQSIFRRE